MFKKIVSVVLCLIIIFAINVFAQETQNTKGIQPSENTSQMPMQDGEQGGGQRGHRPMPPEGFEPGQMPPEGFDRGDIPSADNGQATVIPEDSEQTNGETEEPQANMQDSNFGRVPNGEMPQDFGDAQTQNSDTTQAQSDFSDAYKTIIVSVGVLILGFIFVIFYKRKIY